MAAKITRKNTSKKVGTFVEINYDGEVKNVEIQTKKKCFGSVNINEENGNLIGKCITCAKKYNEVAEACTVKSDPKGFEFKSVRVGKRGPSKVFIEKQAEKEEAEWNGIARKSSMFEFVTFLNENGPSTMGQIKKAIRRTHYNTVKKYPAVFAKTGSLFSLVITEGI